MCLVVSHVPISRSAGMIVPCVKKVDWSLWTRRQFETYNLGYRIPTHGVLLPGYAANDCKVYQGDEINGGYIHAYIEDTPLRKHARSKYGPMLFPAYAFGVVAYGDEDLICKALYIPKCDLHASRRKKMLSKIKSLLRSKSPSVENIRDLHPLLSDFCSKKRS